MNTPIAYDDLDGLETEPERTCGFTREIVRGFRKAVQAIRAARDERDLYALRGLHFEKLKGTRAHQHSVRINKQWRLILELRGEATNKRVKIVSIEDYH